MELLVYIIWRIILLLVGAPNHFCRRPRFAQRKPMRFLEILADKDFGIHFLKTTSFYGAIVNPQT